MPTYNAQAALPGGEPGPWGDPVTINYEKRDVLLYAVGIGIQDLRFVFADAGSNRGRQGAGRHRRFRKLKATRHTFDDHPEQLY